MQYDCFILTKALKIKIFQAMIKGRSMKLTEPFIILLPEMWLDKIPTNFTYPIIFRESKVYLVSDINEVKVYEDE